jgi:hypothetical protein
MELTLDKPFENATSLTISIVARGGRKQTSMSFTAYLRKPNANRADLKEVMSALTNSIRENFNGPRATPILESTTPKSSGKP